MQDLITFRTFNITGITFTAGYNSFTIPWEEQEWYNKENYHYVVTSAIPYVSADITCIGWNTASVRFWSDKAYTQGYHIGMHVLQIAKFAE